MKLIFANLIIVLFTLSAFSQEEEIVVLKVNKDSIAKENPVYFNVDKMPEFNGGMEALFKFYQETSKYTVVKDEKGYKSVYFKIIININGQVTDFEILQGQSEMLDNETKRIVQQMPNWKPGKKNGEKVRVQKTLVINYDI